MTITTNAINDQGYIISRFTCDGENINPRLAFAGVPENAKSLALIIDDPDAPVGTFTHWTLYNIPSTTIQIDEGILPTGAKQGINSFGRISYGGPCPPAGSAHRYYFKLYALDNINDLSNGVEIQELIETINNHTIEKCEIFGKYKK
ncbi:MAG TPA: YbhB/YbcL family Raf kinase inhibitor-like protein [Patescibacteria group bacterium]|nr:YbhB/YbcL family Raf kinase inhibitor-like protein [Patescibacteria group bacterium]